MNPHPENKRGKLWLHGEWISKNKCRKWTEKEIEEGIGNTKKYGKVKIIPIKCGHCDICRLSRANEWVTRCTCEIRSNSGVGCKIDLTYNSLCVPEGYVLKKSDYQSFYKKLKSHVRRNEGPEIAKKMKMYIGGEYGPEKGRPHYHMIIMNWIPNDTVYWKDSATGYPMYKSKLIDSKWTKKIDGKWVNMGFATIEHANPKTISYATRYTNKKSGKAKKNKRVAEFQTQSQGIGKLYWEQKKDEIIENLGIWIKKDEKAQLCPIPRYYKKLWQKENRLQFEMYQDYQELQNERKEEIRKQQTDLSKIEYIQRSTESAKIVFETLKRRGLEAQNERLDIANDIKYNKHAVG